MGNCYTHLSGIERTTIMVMRAEGFSPSRIAVQMGRDRSTIGRELARNGAGPSREPDAPARPYDATEADRRAKALLHASGGYPKLAPDTALFAVVYEQLREGWSPEQIAGVLKRASPDDPSKSVCHETIYSAIYITPHGALRRDLIDCLRQSRGKRRPRSRGKDRRGRIADMASLHVRPPEIQDRLVPGHWEGDLIKGAGNRSSVGTLVERTSRLVLLARMDDATAEGALAAFTQTLNRVHGSMRKTLTYDQGKEMARHKDLTKTTGVAVYFADPHSPWQRGSNENTNGLLRQYLPKGTDLSVYTQADLDAIAWRLNTRPRRIHGFRTPSQVYQDHLSGL
jgi:IS30 family transposase